MVAGAMTTAETWTQERRELAAATEVRTAFIDYFHRMMKERNWLPWDDLPLEEIRELGARLSEDTVRIIEGFYGLESQVGNFVADGLDMLHKMRERRNLHIAWGAEEFKHAEALELVLTHSGRRTKEEVETFRAAVLAHRWRMQDEHPDLDHPLGFICFGLLQERASWFSYDALRRRIRGEYGLDAEPSPDECARGVEVGAAGAVQRIAGDEQAHYEVFLTVVQIYLRYFPHETLATLQRMFNSFSTPALRLLPDPAQLTEALERTLISTPLQYVRNVRNVVLDALGFESKCALDRAVHAVQQLAADWTPDRVRFDRDGQLLAPLASDAAGE